MGGFKTWRAFSNFEREVRRDRRFIRSAQAEAFLSAVRETCESRRRVFSKGQMFYRAQIGHSWTRKKKPNNRIPCPYPPNRMSPQKDRALEGRANSKGIPVLYLATSANAALSEVRPWLGSLISLGSFESVRALSVIEFAHTYKAGEVAFFKEPSPEVRERTVWIEIGHAFSKPVTRSDDTGEYVATQILAEMFRHLGFDGVAYRSAFGGESMNVALFDLKVAKLKKRALLEVTDLNFKFSPWYDTFSTLESAVAELLRE